MRGGGESPRAETAVVARENPFGDVRPTDDAGPALFGDVVLDEDGPG